MAPLEKILFSRTAFFQEQLQHGIENSQSVIRIELALAVEQQDSVE